MDPMSAGIVGGSLGAALIVVKAIELLWPGRKSRGSDALADLVREQTSVLRKIEERMIGSGYELHQQSQTLTRIETSQQALHRRFDTMPAVRQP